MLPVSPRRPHIRHATRRLCTVALGTALLAVSAWVAIPLPWGYR